MSRSRCLTATLPILSLSSVDGASLFEQNIEREAECIDTLMYLKQINPEYGELAYAMLSKENRCTVLRLIEQTYTFKEASIDLSNVGPVR